MGMERLNHEMEEETQHQELAYQRILFLESVPLQDQASGDLADWFWSSFMISNRFNAWARSGYAVFGEGDLLFVS